MVSRVYATVAAEIEWIKDMVCQLAENPPVWACMGDRSPVPTPGGSPLSSPPTLLAPTPTVTAPTTVPPPNPSPSQPTPSNPFGDATVEVVVVHDNYPEETAWSLMAPNGTILLSQAQGSISQDSLVVSRTVRVVPGQYTFTINDSVGDGICCSYGTGEYEILVDDSRLFSGGNFGESSGDLRFCILQDGTATTGECVVGSDGGASVGYYLSVEYDFWASETGVQVNRVSTGEVVELFRRGSATESYAFRYSQLDLIQGERYELIVTDSFGDGMADGNPSNWPFDMGYAAVDIYVNDEWYEGLSFISGNSFDQSARDSFTVPMSLSAKQSHNDFIRPKKGTTKKFCNNTNDKFTVRSGVEKGCSWLEQNWPKTESFCDQLNIAAACPSTCGVCA